MPVNANWEIPPDLLAKAIGAISGSAVSLAYVLPKGRREAALRFLTGLACGVVFGSPAGAKLAIWMDIEGALSGFEMAMTGAAAASLCAWWALGVLARIAERAAAPKN